MSQLFEAAVYRIAETVQPLMFETGIAAAPYSQAGTVFVIGRRGRARVVTCRHALWPDDLHPICLFPADGKRSFLPLRDVSYVPASLLAEDFADLAMIDVDIPSATRGRQGYARILNLDLDLPDWRLFSHTSDFVVLGYPAERSYIDYDDYHMHSERVALYARYVGPHISAHMHTASVADTKQLASFSGFSGGPVFSLLQRPGHLPVLLFCGMAVQGSAQSRLIHFLEAGLIVDAADAW